MPRPVPVPLRRALVRRWEQGQSPAQIALALQFPVRTVRHLIQRYPLEAQVGRPLVAGPGAEVVGGPGGQVEAFQVGQTGLPERY